MIIPLNTFGQYSMNPIHPKTRKDTREFTFIYEKNDSTGMSEEVGIHYYDISSTRCALTESINAKGFEFYKDLKFLPHRTTIYFYEIRDTLWVYIDGIFNKHFDKYEPKWFDELFDSYYDMTFYVTDIHTDEEFQDEGERHFQMKLKGDYEYGKSYTLTIDRKYNYDGDSETYYYILSGDDVKLHIDYNERPTMVFQTERSDMFLNKDFWKISDKFIHHVK